jgi:recombination associated protein RdgC
MWFKQIQFFQLTDSLKDTDAFAEKLEALTFTPCLPSLPASSGWVAPLGEEEDAPLVRTLNSCHMLCLQQEEKILPATVIRQTLDEKIKQLESLQDRKIRQKEKLALKDEITHTLLPRAFSKRSKLYAYIDTKNHWLILNTTHTAKTEQFLTLFKRAVTENIYPFELKKLAPILTHWLQHKSYPNSFSIEKSCVLQDSKQQNRVIRCQQQDLFAGSIQALIKDGCEAKQLALCWHDQLKFTLTDDFTLRSIQMVDEITEQTQEGKPLIMPRDQALI